MTTVRPMVVATISKVRLSVAAKLRYAALGATKARRERKKKEKAFCMGKIVITK